MHRILQCLLVRIYLIFNNNYPKSMEHYVSAENDQYKQLWQDGWHWFSMRHPATFTKRTASVAPPNLWKCCFTCHNSKHCITFSAWFSTSPSSVCCLLRVSVCACARVYLSSCVDGRKRECLRVCVIRGRNWIRDGSAATVRWKYLAGRATCPEEPHTPTFHKTSPACMRLLNGCLLWVLAAFTGVTWLYYTNSRALTALL